jgi:class 3 adenylate cyclase/ABC-type branched-subunit amino acid transport system substrate-binding protein
MFYVAPLSGQPVAPTIASVSGSASDQATSTGGGLASSSTRAFLFADLRGYTRFADEHGALAAADLLDRYRGLVRGAVSRFAGAEIRTEGDSFYVVFYSVSAAIGCALAILEAASAASTDRPDAPITVGIGIHAGETVEAGGDFVGSPVNVAARLCALAGPGELLVSDTVRSLTQAVVPVTFEPRGRRSVKGITEPIGVYAVAAVEQGDDAWQLGARSSRARRTRRRRFTIAAAGMAAIAITAIIAAFALWPPGALPPGPWTIAVDATLSGPFAEDLGKPIVPAVELAVEAAAGNARPGVEVDVTSFDHGREESWLSFEEYPAHAEPFVSDPRVIAVVGPVFSHPTSYLIPQTNEAGLLQCSPGASDPALTQPGWGDDIGLTHPDRRSFIRVYPTNASEGRAMAAFARNDLGIERVLVVDDGRPGPGGDRDEFGAAMGRSFADAFEQVGGVVTRHTLNTGETMNDALGSFDSGTPPPQAVYTAMIKPASSAELRLAMVSRGLESLPLLGFEHLTTPDEKQETYVDLAGGPAVGTYATTPVVGAPRSSFVEAFRARTGAEPSEIVTAAAACADIVIGAMERIAPTAPSADGLREAVRAAVVENGDRFETVLGPVGFDEGGDSTQQVIQVRRVADPVDTGDPWVTVKEQDYGSGS